MKAAIGLPCSSWPQASNPLSLNFRSARYAKTKRVAATVTLNVGRERRLLA